MLKHFVYILVSVIGLQGCRKDTHTNGTEGNYCPELKVPELSTNSPVSIGDELQLFAESSEPEVAFEWIGPEGFQSGEKNPVLPGISYSANGTYRCRIKRAGCVSAYASIAVTVKDPCGILSVNTANVSGVPWNFFNGVLCGPTGSNGFFGVTAENNVGFIQVIFGNRYERPAGFDIFPVSLFPVADSSSVQIRLIENGTEFRALAGVVYSAITHQKSILTFCGILCESTLSTQRTVNARIGCE